MRGLFLVFLLFPFLVFPKDITIPPVFIPPGSLEMAEPRGGEILRTLLKERLSNLGWDVSPPRPGELKGDLLQTARAWAVEEGSDFSLLVILRRWSERVGGPLGVQRPAEVAFHLFLIRAKDEKILWEKALWKRQKSLSEDLLQFPGFLEKGLKWYTASELADLLIKKALKELGPPQRWKSSQP